MSRRVSATVGSLIAVLLCGCIDPPQEYTARREYQAGYDALVFAGTDTWEVEVMTIREILTDHGAGSRQVTSAELNEMSLDQIAEYRMLIVPGGNAITMTSSLTAETHARLRAAVQERGMSYLGFCAGAWMAIAPAPEPGKDVVYGLGVVDGPIQEKTSMEEQGHHIRMNRAALGDGSYRHLLWYGGPITPDQGGSVVAKYADGKPAITQIRSGNGFVTVSGLHPAVPDFVKVQLSMEDDDGSDYELAWKILESGLYQKPLPAF